MISIKSDLQGMSGVGANGTLGTELIPLHNMAKSACVDLHPAIKVDAIFTMETARRVIGD